MPQQNLVTRKTFLTKTGAAAAGVFLSPMLTNAFVKDETMKIKVAVIGCGSVSNMYLPHSLESFAYKR